MPEVKGKLITCSRCSEGSIFLRHLEHVEMDGGFSKGYDRYEELPNEWLWGSEFGHLCPECASKFRKFMSEFLGEKVPPKWRYETKGEEL